MRSFPEKVARNLCYVIGARPVTRATLLKRRLRPGDSYQQRPASHSHHVQPRPRRPRRPLPRRPRRPRRPLRPASADDVVAVTTSPDTAIVWRKYTPTIAIAAKTFVKALKRMPPDMFPVITLSLSSLSTSEGHATPKRRTRFLCRCAMTWRLNWRNRPNVRRKLRKMHINFG